MNDRCGFIYWMDSKGVVNEHTEREATIDLEKEAYPTEVVVLSEVREIARRTGHVFAITEPRSYDEYSVEPPHERKAPMRRDK